MKRQFFSGALTLTMLASTLILAACSTVETRISGHPEIYQSLSPSDQALVSQGQIRDGMLPNAVYLAWGSPDRKIVGNMRGRSTETWVYVHYTTYSYPYPYPFYGPGYGWGYGFGLTTVGFAGRASLAQWSQLFVLWQPLLRSILLFLHTAKHPLSIQDGHFRQWQGRLLPVHGAALSLIKNSVAF
jgi:hypothetical protein